MSRITRYLCTVLAIPLILLTSCSAETYEEAETAQATVETTLSEDISEAVLTEEAATETEYSAETEIESENNMTAETEMESEDDTIADSPPACECQYEWQHTYCEYLNGLNLISGGVYLGDINGDDIPEAVVEINPYEFTHVLYCNKNGLQILPLETVSMWGDVIYISDTKQILFIPMYGHTTGTYGFVEEYLYSWDGTNYAEALSLYREGCLYYDENGEFQQFYGDALINGEIVDNDTFEAEDDKLTALAEGNSYFPIVSPIDENFENYVKENFPCFYNWDIIKKCPYP